MTTPSAKCLYLVLAWKTRILLSAIFSLHPRKLNSIASNPSSISLEFICLFNLIENLVQIGRRDFWHQINLDFRVVVNLPCTFIKKCNQTNSRSRQNFVLHRIVKHWTCFDTPPARRSRDEVFWPVNSSRLLDEHWPHKVEMMLRSRLPWLSFTWKMEPLSSENHSVATRQPRERWVIGGHNCSNICHFVFLEWGWGGIHRGSLVDSFFPLLENRSFLPPVW